MSNGISGLNTSYADTYDATSSALTNKINGTDFSNASDDELMSVCKDFESYFVEQIIKTMEKMSKVDGDDDDDSSLFSSLTSLGGETDSATKTMGSYFGDKMISQYAEIITESNGGKGLGIAQMLYEQMKRNYSSDAVTGDNETVDSETGDIQVDEN
ncbi:MAG: hypothetical protein ACI4D4_00725 [Lachnospira sp.]